MLSDVINDMLPEMYDVDSDDKPASDTWTKVTGHSCNLN